MLVAGHDLLHRLGVRLPSRASRGVVTLSYSPLKRELSQRKKGKLLDLKRSGRVLSVLVQATGTEVRPGCAKCSRANGPWSECIIIQTGEGQQATKGACANCLWNNQGPKCSFCTLHGPLRTPLISRLLPLSHIILNIFHFSWKHQLNTLLDSPGNIQTHPPREEQQEAASSSLENNFSGFHCFESQFQLMSRIGIGVRVSSLARSPDSALQKKYDDTQFRITSIQNVIANLTQEACQLSQELSEIAVISALNRTFDRQRVPIITLPIDTEDLSNCHDSSSDSIDTNMGEAYTDADNISTL